MYNHNHQEYHNYKVLGLQFPGPGRPAASQQEIRSAYRHALLSNHPDKRRNPNSLHPKPTWYTVDEITRAYKLLIDSAYQQKYGRQVKLDLHENFDGNHETPYSGIETLDLDELNRNDDGSEWYRNCPCGDVKGLRVTEDELQENGDYGEVIVSCSGCSLKFKVTFAMAGDG